MAQQRVFVPTELGGLAKDLLIARASFNRAYRRWLDGVEPCTDESGWKVLEVLRVKVAAFCFTFGRYEQGVKSATWEIFRLQLIDRADYGFEDLIGFVKWYRMLRNRIEEAIGHLYDFHGDSFGDLIDSYPLAGQELVERALATHPKSDRPRREGYLDDREVANAVLDKRGPEWHKLICQGPNYIVNGLETAVRKYYLHRVLSRHEQVTLTAEEVGRLDGVGLYED